jgi:hypothetical protein
MSGSGRILPAGLLVETNSDPKVLSQVPSIASLDDLVGRRQVLVDDLCAQVLDIFKRLRASGALYAAICRWVGVLDVRNVGQVDVPSVALVAANPDVSA